MGTNRYPENALEREYLRGSLRRQGADSVDQIAQAIRERWAHSPLRSYRKACELSLEQVCEQVNRILEVFAGEPGYFTHSTLSRYETWPAAPKSRRPALAHLVALAEVYGTHPRHLVADADWARFPPADRYALRALATHPETSPGTTETATPVRMMDEAQPQAGTIAQAPLNWWAAPTPATSGDPVERSVLMTGEESARYADHGGNIGDTNLELLRTEIAIQSQRFANTDRLALFGTVRLLRDRIFAYLDGGQPMNRRRDLYFMAGAACGLLAAVSADMGYQGAAMSHARAGNVFALEAGDSALSGWMYAMQANICYWNSQHAKARDYARQGAALQPMSSVAVWLPAIEARACGELGDVPAVRDAVRRATEVREDLQPHVIDEFGGQLGFNEAKQHYYIAGSFLGVADYPAVISQAEEAIREYEQGPAEECNLGNVAIARFHAAIAHVQSGTLDAASEWAQAAQALAPELRTIQVDKSARRLHRQLRAPGVGNAPLAIETRDQIEEFLSVSPARLELS